MQPLLIGLLRHGEVRGGIRFRGRTDDPLTAAGEAQMRAALADGPSWHRIVSSPLRRCAGFARAQAAREALPLAFDARLREMDFGAWEGRSAAELMDTDAVALGAFWRDPADHGPPGGEPLAGFRARVLAAWRDLVAGPGTERVLVVTHGGVIRVLLAHVLGGAAADLARFDVPHGGLFPVAIDASGRADAWRAPDLGA